MASLRLPDCRKMEPEGFSSVKAERRHHWHLSHHCTEVLYPESMPNLQLPSREARFYWQLYARGGLQQPYEINLARALHRSLRRNGQTKLRGIFIPRDLVRIGRLDCLERKRIIGEIGSYVRRQRQLVEFSMEGLGLRRMEGIGLVLSLGNSRKTLKCLQLWGAFQRREGPLLVDTGHFAGSGLYRDRIIRGSEWLTALGCLEALTTLSLNYAYIATDSGDFLVALSKKIGVHWQWLQLLCTADEVPVITNPHDGIGGHRIPDSAWKEAVTCATLLKVQFVFVDVSEYDKQRRFLSRSIPVHTLNVSTSVQMFQGDPFMIDCTIRTLWCWYPQTLVNLMLQLWHQREALDSLLKKMLINLPHLELLEFTGELRDLRTLSDVHGQAKIHRKIKCIRFYLQKPIDETSTEVEWKQKVFTQVSSLPNNFKERDLEFLISFYPM